MKNEQSRMLTAFVLSGIILFGWQFFFAPKKNKLPSANQSTTKVEAIPSSQPNQKTQETLTSKSEEITPEQSFTLSGTENSYTFTNSLTLTEAKKGDLSAQKDLYESKKLISFKFLIDNSNKKIPFVITKNSATSLSGSNENAGIKFIAEITDNNLKLTFNKSPKSSVESVNLSFFSKPGRVDSYQIRSFAFAGTDLTTVEVGDDEQESVNTQWVGLDYKYYLLATVLPEKKYLNIKTNSATNSLETYLNFNDKNEINLSTVFEKKEYDRLHELGNNLHLSVDFGIFSFIAIPILRGLQFFYSLIANYGFAIIMLTIVIRLLTFPLQYKSTKSMKKMQVIQPQLKKIQEKYKDKPQQLQKESMELFKRAGANPLSGCFPLLLQMPIFFAFYKVLYNSVELVNAPFYFWINDLSSKDPYYVLPVLMTAAMFLQQKLTPTATTDATQKKVMLFMPIVFGFIMKDLPSGLNLYIFISTLIAIILQMMVLKNIKA